MVTATTSPPVEQPADRSGPLTDLALTLPIFIGYHLGVVFLPVRNAADPLTSELQKLAYQSVWIYFTFTVAIGLAYVTPLLLLGRGKHLDLSRFALMGGEGILYAILMRILAGYAVFQLVQMAQVDPSVFGLMKAAPALSSAVEIASAGPSVGDRLSGAIMSLGAGFYEELLFRAGVYGAGAFLLIFLFHVTSMVKKMALRVVWALLAACLFSGWHHFGDFGEAFDLSTFAFRAVCGLVFTVIYETRGLAPAVWTHALYDLWVLAF